MSTTDILKTSAFSAVDWSSSSMGLNGIFVSYENTSTLIKEVFVDLIDPVSGGATAEGGTFEVTARTSDAASGITNPLFLSPIDLGGNYTVTLIIGTFSSDARIRFALPDGLPFRVPVGKFLSLDLKGVTSANNTDIDGSYEVIDARYVSDVELVDGGTPGDVSNVPRYALDTTVASATNKNTFVLTAGKSSAAAYLGMVLAITDADDSNVESRVITSWTSARATVVNKDYSFTPAASDVARIMENAYFDDTLVGSASSKIQSDIAAIPSSAGTPNIR